ncbi:MAG: class I SAM-dependent methyltransferase [Nitrosopumilus sp.]|nr:class I SAM-dependent methyltransferase [Nitrosopumilus sp.]
MRIEEYLAGLPADLMSGDAAELPRRALEEALGFAGVAGESFCHVGCGGGEGLAAALRMGAKSALGVDSDPRMVERARAAAPGARVVCADALEADISGSSLVLFWFADPGVTEQMVQRFDGMDGARVLTLWGPLPGCLPDEVRFPYVLTRTPPRRAGSVREQVRAVFGTDCVDFVTAWEHAERYTRAVSPPGSKNDRFLTIIQTLSIWTSARAMGVACGDGIPDPIRAYAGIMREHFGIEFGHLLE